MTPPLSQGQKSNFPREEEGVGNFAGGEGNIDDCGTTRGVGESGWVVCVGLALSYALPLGVAAPAPAPAPAPPHTPAPLRLLPEHPSELSGGPPSRLLFASSCNLIQVSFSAALQALLVPSGVVGSTCLMSGSCVVGMAFACNTLFAFLPSTNSLAGRCPAYQPSRGGPLLVAYKGPETREIPPWEQEMLELFSRSPLLNPELRYKHAQRPMSSSQVEPKIDLDVCMESNTLYGIRKDIMEIFVLAARDKPGIRLTVGEPGRQEVVSPRAAVKQVNRRMVEKERPKDIRGNPTAKPHRSARASVETDSWESELNAIFEANPLTRK
eukprot:762970-Hanusia_phi.AAC.8